MINQLNVVTQKKECVLTGVVFDFKARHWEIIIFKQLFLFSFVLFVNYYLR